MIIIMRMIMIMMMLIITSSESDVYLLDIITEEHKQNKRVEENAKRQNPNRETP